MNHVETHIGNNMKNCAIRAQLITILLVTLRLCRRRALLLKVTGLENRATFPPIRNSTDSNELLKYFSEVPAKDIIGIGKSIAVTLKYLVTITTVL